MQMKNNEAILEKRAKDLLRLLDPTGIRGEGLPRPFIIELTGNPDSGKTTIIDSLRDFFKEMGYRVDKPLEGAEVVKLPRTNFRYNVATGIYAMNILMGQLNSGAHELVLFDRCLYDAWGWMEYWLWKKDISKELAREVQNFFTKEAWRKEIDIAFFVMCDPKEAVRRNLETSIIKETGRFSSPKSSKKLANIFRNEYNYFKRKNAPVILIDTTKLSKDEQAKLVLNHALDAFERRFEKNKKYQKLPKKLSSFFVLSENFKFISAPQ